MSIVFIFGIFNFSFDFSLSILQYFILLSTFLLFFCSYWFIYAQNVKNVNLAFLPLFIITICLFIVCKYLNQTDLMNMFFYSGMGMTGGIAFLYYYLFGTNKQKKTQS